MKSKRFLILDFLRGYFLCVIVIDHLGRFPGVYEYFSGQAKMWVSAAEGFFFISGMMIGYVRGRKNLEKKFDYVYKKLLSRAFLLYVLAIVMTLFFTFVGYFYANSPNLKNNWEPINDTFHFVIDILTLDYSYGWTDFLRYYAVFILASPIAIYFLRKKQWYIVGISSILIWFFFRESDSYAAWQIIFFIGSIVGFYIPEIVHFYNHISRKIKVALVSSILIISFITFVASAFATFVLDNYAGQNIYDSFLWLRNFSALFVPRDYISFPRLIIFGFWFLSLVFILHKYFYRIPDRIKNIFLFFGQNSLIAFILQGLVVFFSSLWIPKSESVIYNFAVVSGVFVVLYFSVKGIVWMNEKKFKSIYVEKYITTSQQIG